MVAIGNAPTALFRLLEMIEAGAGRPAAVIGIPVGFIGAAESKQALADFSARTGAPKTSALPTTQAPRRSSAHETSAPSSHRPAGGGSAVTAAAVNAIASEEE